MRRSTRNSASTVAAAARSPQADALPRRRRVVSWAAMRIIRVFWLAAAAVCVAQPVLKNPFANDPRAAEEGRIAFRGSCALCHGIHAEGGRGPDLTLGTYSVGDTDGDLYKVIYGGAAGREMPAFGANFESGDLWRLVTYLRSLAGKGKVAATGDRQTGSDLFWN